MPRPDHPRRSPSLIIVAPPLSSPMRPLRHSRAPPRHSCAGRNPRSRRLREQLADPAPPLLPNSSLPPTRGEVRWGVGARERARGCCTGLRSPTQPPTLARTANPLLVSPLSGGRDELGVLPLIRHSDAPPRHSCAGRNVGRGMNQGRDRKGRRAIGRGSALAPPPAAEGHAQLFAVVEEIFFLAALRADAVRDLRVGAADLPVVLAVFGVDGRRRRLAGFGLAAAARLRLALGHRDHPFAARSPLPDSSTRRRSGAARNIRSVRRNNPSGKALPPSMPQAGRRNDSRRSAGQVSIRS